MKNLGDIIIDSISGDMYREDISLFRAETSKAVLTPDGRLDLVVKLNFVVSEKDEEKIESRIMDMVPQITGVISHKIYDTENMATAPDETAALYAGRCVSALSPVVRNAVDTDKITASSGVVHIKAVGGASLDELNKIQGKNISAKIKEKFGLDYEVLFEHDHEARKQAAKKIDLSHEELARIAQEDAAKESALKPDTGQSSGVSAFDAGAGSESIGGESTSSAPFGRRRGTGSIFTGTVTGDPIAINDLKPDLGEVVIAGTIFHIETRPIRDDRLLVMMHITDKTNSTCLKAFMTNKQWEKGSEKIKEGVYVICKGKAEFNVFDNEMDVVLSRLNVKQMPEREDTYDGPHRVELHCHTKMSAMDGLNEPDKIVETAARWDSPQLPLQTTASYRASLMQQTRQRSLPRQESRSKSSTGWKDICCLTKGS